MFVDFVGVCFDQIYNQAAKFRYMFGGKAKTPMVIRTAIGAGLRAGAPAQPDPAPAVHHGAGAEGGDAVQSLRRQGTADPAIRDDDPVIFMESKLLYGMEGEVPDEAYRVPFGEANVVREGKDVTFVAFGAMVPRAWRWPRPWPRTGISVEVIDPRTTSPLDEDSILESVEKTGRLVVDRREPAALLPGRRHRRPWSPTRASSRSRPRSAR